MRSTFGTRSKLAALVAGATIALGLPAAVPTPAAAVVLDTDHPKVTKTHFDFGKGWVLGAPVDGGDLEWDLVSGRTWPKLDGYLYLTDRESGRVNVEYFDASHNLLGSRNAPTYTAPGNGKTQWWVDIDSFSSTSVTHVHVNVQRANSNGSFTTMGTDTEDFD